MKHLFTALLLLCCLTATAHDFDTGGIYYNITSNTDKTVCVTYRGTSYNDYYNEYTSSVVIPESVTYSGTTYSVTSIEDYAFYNCTGLTSITIPNSVTSIGDFAFDKCTKLTSITIPNSVTSIGSFAFSRCTGLTSVVIPNSVTSIGKDVFYNCTGLTSIEVGSGNSVYDSRENCNAIIETATKTLIKGCNSTIIPNSVTSIGDFAFDECTKLTSITIPNSVTSIGSGAFSRCTGLTSVVIPNSVTSIGESAFYNCTGLTSIEIPNSVTSIGNGAFNGTAWYNNQPDGVVYAGKVFYEYKGTMPSNTSITIKDGTLGIAGSAFYNCTGLTSIEIPNSVTSIGSGAFYNCTGLTSIQIPNSVTSIGIQAFYNCKSLTSIQIPNSVTSIGESAFSRCTGLTSIEIPGSVTSIGSLAFFGCKGLTSITIPNSVTSIGDFAFDKCTRLTSVTIGTGVKNIDSEAFAECDNLTDVYCLATSVPEAHSDAFKESYPEYMTLHVPEEAIDSYKTTAPWSSFGTVVTIDGDVTETPKCATPTVLYSNGKLHFECETEGAEFVTEITSSDFNKFYNNDINLTATYNISVYATATGYENSDIVNATLCWVECECEGDDTGIINIPAKAVLVTSSNGSISISCSLDGESVAVYTTAGTLIATTAIENGTATVATGLSKGSVAIVNIAGKSIKVIVD